MDHPSLSQQSTACNDTQIKYQRQERMKKHTTIFLMVINSLSPLHMMDKSHTNTYESTTYGRDYAWMCIRAFVGGGGMPQ